MFNQRCVMVITRGEYKCLIVRVVSLLSQTEVRDIFINILPLCLILDCM